MRTARLVGPGADGSSWLVETEDGEQLSVVLDPATRARLDAGPAESDESDESDESAAGPRPSDPAVRPAARAPRRRESSVTTPLSPRDIQTRIRAGESVEEVLADLPAGSGMDADRVERFTAPVVAEREHMALTALGATLRRRGDSSAHRNLRTVVAERLLGAGVDADDVSWDAWKTDDTHWQVVADYELANEPRHAEFRYDPQGRFLLAEDDDARWLAGERPSPVAAFVDRDDELALIRATSETSPDEDGHGGEDGHGAEGAQQDAGEPVGHLLDTTTEDLVDSIVAELGLGMPDDLTDDLDDTAGDHEDTERLADTEDTVVPRDEAAEPTIAVVRRLTTVEIEVEPDAEPERSALDTLYDMLGGDGYAEDSTRVYPGLTDAAAVPEVDERDFEPGVDILFPVEPDPDPQVEAETRGDSDQPEETDEPSSSASEEMPEPLVPSPGASRRTGRRKRASVPSWDEIMFGGPKQS